MADPLSGAGHNGHTSPLGDVTPALMYEFLDRYDGYLEERKAVNKQGKDLRKDIEKAGIPLPGWDLFVKLREEAGVVRESNDAAYRQLMAWDAKPVGLQASMDLTVSQGSPELNVHELKRVDNEGFEAGKAGKNRDRNPYTPGTEAATRFDTSWLRGQAEIASTLGTGEDNGPKRRGRPLGSGKKQREAAGAEEAPAEQIH